ncbi:MAG: epoxyqueuosine reductase QueH [Ruminococcaceae bacterium]|nr:epoxyqueuosine reductase QueH [Oscillospiraceae bacterium]
MMQQKINYQKILEKKLAEFEAMAVKPRLLLHACCAPCSSYTLEYLSPYFREISVFFYNPNITPTEEYNYRLAELQRMMENVQYGCPVTVLPGIYDPERFTAMARGMESLPEGGGRCYKCYDLRLRETGRTAAESGFDWFTTTLSISPYKNAAWLNEIGTRIGEELGVPYLQSDFKKNGGYARSIVLSKEYGLYRQNWCGCVYSRRDAENP